MESATVERAPAAEAPPTNTREIRVCVIGAGSSGISSCQVLHARGIPFVCFEVGSEVGGNWRYMNDNGMSSAYRSLHINTSRRSMAYATYPMPEDYPDYPDHFRIARYFDDYVDHFGFREHIRFRTEVTTVEPADGGGWRVRWRELDMVNQSFNRSIKPVTDQEQYGVAEYWTYAVTGSGDCEEYVLEKRRRLIQLGWSPASLLISVVIDKQNGGHAVLTAVTDQGEFVLDNITDDIVPWSKSGLMFVKRQSPSDPNIWVDLGRVLGTPEVITAATRR